MKLKIFVNENHEDNKALVDMDVLEMIVAGDNDNEHIDDVIDGVLTGLDYLGKEYEIETVYISEGNMFDLCMFY